MRYLVVTVALFLAWTAPLSAQPVTVGEHVDAGIETPHPYPAGDGTAAKLVWSDEIYFPDATYIAPHFERFQLAPGDRVVVRSRDGAQTWTYTGLGKANLGLSENGFFAVHIKGDTAIIELWSQNPQPLFGYKIDRYGRGYSMDEIRTFWDAGLGEKMNLPELPEEIDSICTANDSEEAKCYQTSEPQIYDRARAVVRLLLNGSSWCTGWLIGCDGHVMTNEHCIGSQAQLNDIDFEWMAEGADCATNCQSPLACPGTIEASGGTMVQFDAPLDYALVIPDTSIGGGTNLNDTYGFLQLRDTGPVVGERMYIVHHPAGWGKHLSVQSSYPLEPNPPFASVISVDEVACSGAPPEGDVGYWADTQGGSSGSPVLGYADHRVIALHHCRGAGSCTNGSAPPDDPNRGVPIQAVIADLGGNLPGCAVCDPPDAPTGLSATPNGNNRIDLSWTGSAGADSYNIFRAIGGCPQGSYEEIATGVAGTSYSDTTVSGGITYSYVVRAFDQSEGCESMDSGCTQADATGLCTLAPTFDGLETATNSGSASCALDLDWSAAAASCGASVVYNIWRSTTPGFDPDATEPLATCVGATTYQDTTVDFGTDYYYVVRAEDQSGNGSGPCAGGNSDNNTAEQSAAAAGPENEVFGDDIESGAGNWTLTTGDDDTGTAVWAIVDTDSHSPTHSWFTADEDDVKDQRVENSASIAVGPGSVLTFWHHFDTELNWDGGVLEYSTDGGTTWFDILDGDGAGVPANADRFLAGGYTAALNTSLNPLGGRQAWHGDSSGFQEVIVDLADFNGESVRFRWRMGCDASVDDVGWWVDDPRIFSGSECVGGFVFGDGFESGNTSAWSSSIP
ncbi:MAG: trypsin-like peptidase domain-containing protein [Acidobacteriota bacterium]